MKWCVYGLLALQSVESVVSVVAGVAGETIRGRKWDAGDVLIHCVLLVLVYLATLWTWTH